MCSHLMMNDILVIDIIQLHKPVILEKVVIAVFPI